MPSPSSINAAVDAQSAYIVRTLQKLVRFPTINPPGRDYSAVTLFLTDELTKLGFKTRRLPIPTKLLRQRQPDNIAYPRFNVIGLWDVGAAKTIHFNAHYDVVPASDDWTHGSAFSGAVEAGNVYGRGSADMKGSIASLLGTIKSLRQSKVFPKCNVEVSFTADEETDSFLGAEWVVKNGNLKADYAIVMEGGEGRSIGCGHNGTIWMEVTVHGRAAHGSTPHKGINALEKMSELILALRGYKKTLASRKWRAPNGTIMRPTVNIGGVFEEGPGGKINTVPALAKFSIDRRVLAVEDHAKAEQELKKILQVTAAKIEDCKITIRRVSGNYSCLTKPDGPFQAAVAASLARVKKVKPEFRVSTGFNDIHFFVHRLHLPTVGYGPDGVNFHGVNENAPISDLVATAKVYADLLTTFEPNKRR